MTGGLRRFLTVLTDGRIRGGQSSCSPMLWWVTTTVGSFSISAKADWRSRQRPHCETLALTRSAFAFRSPRIASRQRGELPGSATLEKKLESSLSASRKMYAQGSGNGFLWESRRPTHKQSRPRLEGIRIPHCLCEARRREGRWFPPRQWSSLQPDGFSCNGCI